MKFIRIKKKISKIIWIGVIIIGLALIAYKFRYTIKHKTPILIDTIAINIFNNQNINIETSSDLNASDFSIVWYGNTPDQKVHVFHGQYRKKVPLNLGNNSFVILYKDSIIGTEGHLKVSRYKYHNYSFKFYQDKADLNYDFTVSGADSHFRATWNELHHWTKSLPNHERVNSPLNLTRNSDSVKHRFAFEFEKKHLKKIKTSSSDLKIKKPPVQFNEMPVLVKSVKTRGRSSMNFPRKSYNVKLKNQHEFQDTDGKSKNLKSFSLLSLSMDQYYFKNRIAFGLLKEVIGVDLFQAYSELKINEKSQGVYYLTEHPKDHLFDTQQADFILRRRYENSNYARGQNAKEIELDYESDKGLDAQATKQYLEHYQKIYRVIKEKSGIELYEELNAMMDLQEYMRIMAFNYVICNGDYTDELFFYVREDIPSKRFNFLPWDFDDIFLNAPHEGWAQRNKRIDNTNKLIFSVEDDLDHIISADSYLHDLYLTELETVIAQLKQSDIKSLFQNTYNELLPYYMNEEIIAQSQFDEFATVYQIDAFENQLHDVYGFLMRRMDLIEQQINTNNF
ncbi:MAG: hypothetical protein RLZZ241_863 [Bacteroidota bacterium]|jgi:spore coat protein H